MKINIPLGLGASSSLMSVTDAKLGHQLQDDPSQPLVDAWNGKGVLFHAIYFDDYADEVEKNGRMHIDGDCGLMCSAWTYNKAGLPVQAFGVGTGIGKIVAVDSDFTREYAMSMTPHDGGALGRQWCSTLGGSYLFGSVKSYSFDLDRMVESSPMYGGPIATENGCDPDDRPCKIIAAGGGKGFMPGPINPFNENSIEEYWNTNLPAGTDFDFKNDFFKANIFAQQLVYSFLYGPPGSQRDGPDCSFDAIELGSSTSPTIVFPGCSECGEVDFCDENTTSEMFYEMYTSPAFNLQRILPTVPAGINIMELTCKFDTNLETSWKSMADAYADVLKEVVDLYKESGAQYSNTWSEVDVFAPFGPEEEKTKASKSLEDDLLGLWYSVDSNNATLTQTRLDQARKIAAVRSANTGLNTPIFTCVGFNSGDIPAAAELESFSDPEFDILGKYGCAYVESVTPTEFPNLAFATN